MAFLRPTTEGYLIYCPACEQLHHIRVGQKDEPNWGFDGDEEFPSFSPSLLVKCTYYENFNDDKPVKTVCHSFIKKGEWQYLSDSTHPLAEQTVKMVDVNAYK